MTKLFARILRNHKNELSIRGYDRSLEVSGARKSCRANCAHLSRLIITGPAWKPRERIQELKVAGDLDVSRGSVREALLILERRHVIEIYPRKGAVVSDLSVQHACPL